jgi:hypothetical protein
MAIQELIGIWIYKGSKGDGKVFFHIYSNGLV